MDLVALLDEADPVGALVTILERVSDHDRMYFAYDLYIMTPPWRPPRSSQGKPRSGSEEVQRAKRAFEDLRNDGSVTDGYIWWYFSGAGGNRGDYWLDACDLIGEAATALVARDRERVTMIAGYLRDLDEVRAPIGPGRPARPG